MKDLPDVLIVTDPVEEKNAILEARKFRKDSKIWWWRITANLMRRIW